jgi:hypothetical protein
MHITPLDPSHKTHLRDFLSLPFSIYRDIPQWVPPLQMDEKTRLDLKRFPFYKHSQARFFLAYEGTRPIGRLAVLDNRRYNEFNRESTAFFISSNVRTTSPPQRDSSKRALPGRTPAG